MRFGNYLAIAVFVALIMWGPLQQSEGWEFAMRLAYLILIPAAVWWIFGWAWNRWEPDEKTENTIEPAVFVAIGIGLLAIAGVKASADSYTGNTNVIRTRDGDEEAGEPIEVKGADWRLVTVLAGLGGALLYVALKKEKKVS
jgi:hypothetical protein